MVELIGGYESWQYAVFIFASCLIGNILIFTKSRFMSFTGMFLWIIGGFALTMYINHELTDNQLRSFGIIIFSVMFVLITIKMLYHKDFANNKKDNG